MSVRLDFGHFPRNQIAGKWQPDDSFIAGAWKLSNFVMSAFPPDFTQFPDGACPLLPGLQEVSS